MTESIWMDLNMTILILSYTCRHMKERELFPTKNVLNHSRTNLKYSVSEMMKDDNFLLFLVCAAFSAPLESHTRAWYLFLSGQEFIIQGFKLL